MLEKAPTTLRGSVVVRRLSRRYSLKRKQVRRSSDNHRVVPTASHILHHENKPLGHTDHSVSTLSQRQTNTNESNSSEKPSAQKLNRDGEYNFNAFSGSSKQPLGQKKSPGIQDIVWRFPTGSPSGRVIYLNENDLSSDPKRRRKRKTLDGSRWCCFVILISLLILLIIAAIVTATTITLSKTTSTTITTLTTITETSSTLTSETTSTTTTFYSCGNMTVWVNTDFPGFDLSSYSGETWASCCALCLANVTCQSFTFKIPVNMCYLKTVPTNNGSYSTVHISARY